MWRGWRTPFVSLLGGIRHVRHGDDRSDFQTPREPDLAQFLRENALPNQKSDFGRTFVLVGTKKTDPPILGYYSLSMGRIPADQFSKEQQAIFPVKTVPTAHLTFIARDGRIPKDRRVGELLMRDALMRVLAAADDVACVGVMLHALNAKLQTYYAQYGFAALALKPSKTNTSQLMFLSLADIRASL
jgi:hypothetical protein